MRTVIKQKNFNINLESTKKFKSTRIHISFASDLDAENITKRAILPYLLRAISKKYDTRTKISSFLDNHYGAQFSVGSSKVGLSHLISFDLNVINDKYTINQESLFEQGIEFLKEILLRPLFKEDIFLEEKRLLDEYFQSTYSNKMRYAIKKMQQSMFHDEVYRLSALGMEEDLAHLALDDVINEYSKMIDNDKITVSIVGDLDVEKTVNIINRYFEFKDRVKTIELLDRFTKNINEITELELIQDVTQAKMALGYRFDVRFMDDDYYPAIIFNSLLGGSSDSLLHMRIREELGLVYFINSSYDFHKGVMFIFSGIDQSEYMNTREEIDRIILKIKNGDYSEKALNIAKKTIINGIIESYDSDHNLVMRLERKDLFDRDVSIEESIQNINNVTIDDIKLVASKLVLDTAMILRGEKNE